MAEENKSREDRKQDETAARGVKGPSYSFEQLARALTALNETPERSIRATSRKFGIPEGTLRYHLLRE